MDTVTTDPTPVATTEPSAAAPATSAPAPSLATSERPKSFEEAFEQVAATQESDASTPTATAATAQADATKPEGATSPSTDKKGPIPFDAHTKALDNARTKAAADAVAQFEREFGWAKQIPREAVAEFAQVASRMTSDPIGFLTDFVKELEAHPTHAAQLRSQAGRILSGGRQATPAVDLSPDVEVRNDQNQVVSRTFSAERVQALIAKAVQDAIGKEVAPLKADRESRLKAESAAATERQLATRADAVMADVHDILDITDPAAEASIALFAAVNEAMAKNPSWTAEKAARAVWKTHVRPGMERQTEQSVLDKHKQKAAGNTANGTGSTATPARPRTPKELEQWLQANSR